MKWPTSWPRIALSLLVFGLNFHTWTHSRSSGFVEGAGWTTERKLEARYGQQVRSLWYHGFDNYMKHAFPLDELRPLSCKGRGPDLINPANIATNDVDGNFSVTLVDALDTFVVLNDTAGFEQAVRNTIDHVQFDVDTKPQVFETTIRVLGGLLSGHLFANQTGQPFHLPWYHGELLDLARDLGTRMLPAFMTPTGLPVARVNLRHGLLRTEAVDTCTAGAGSLILEFGLLSRLTGDTRFEKAAYKAFFALWNRRSDIGLVGNTINTFTGSWMRPEVSGVGAGIDSFFEYALKWYIMSGEVEFLDVWQEAYAAIMRYSRAPDGFWGDLAYNTFDSLSAFWPGLQVLAGDIENAIKSHLTYWNLWRMHSGLPEVWDMSYRQATSLQYPLRPEFVESTWYLYRATRDPFYLDVGGRILYDLITRSKVGCGLASIKDLRSKAHEDRMESFVLSETLKYLYLLFDEDNPVHRDDSNYVFTTEGHILWLEPAHLQPMSPIRRKLRGSEHHHCPAYEPPLVAYDNESMGSGLTAGIRARADSEYIRELIGVRASEHDMKWWLEGGWCEIPRPHLFSFDFILSPGGQAVPEDAHPTVEKITFVPDGYMLYNVSGIRAHIVSRLDGKGYDVTKLGPFAVKTGQVVYVNDPELVLAPLDVHGVLDRANTRRISEVGLRFHLRYVDPLFHLQTGLNEEGPTELFVTASTALFGGDPNAPSSSEGHPPLSFGRGEGVALVADPSNPLGCAPYTRTFADDAVLVQRGDCTFLEKLVHARRAGASGVIVVSDEETNINPSADKTDLDGLEDLIDDAVVVVLRRSVGEAVSAMLAAAEDRGIGQVLVAIESEAQDVQPLVDEYLDDGARDVEMEPDAPREAARMLYINGHPLVNTRLVV
ncbi:glycoside hydrolase family 47 protein [Daedalea quercina L-15889]|uniref:alpha-1,2-Mannosidase n=1 Tax=Daedalea quercina L-15889 TaxID=1314783 RepID=A0A165U650_9APHY|nr:glycoside hydrolase family 47 protein [Daedalea quercina L-15889]